MENCFEKIGRLEDKKVSHLKGNKGIREWGNKFISKAILVKYYLNRLCKGPLTTHHSPFTNKKAAFTLAEVLITLGIIGVVAAITMPTLISKHNANVTVNKLKKFYSVMSQATNMAVNEYGPMEDWDGFTSYNNPDEMQAWFNKYLKPYLNNVDTKIEIVDNNGLRRFVVYFPDGSAMQMYNWSASVPNLDENGKDQNHVSDGWNGYIHAHWFSNKKFALNPDLQKKCINQFTFLFHDQINRRYGFYPYNNGFNPTSRDTALASVKNISPQNCAAFLMYDGWRIADDYPFKF